MTQIAVLVEGQTEEQFVQRVLQPWLNPGFAPEGCWLTPIIVTTSRTAAGVKRRGGGTWANYDRDLRRLLAQSHWHRIGLLLDYYAYPKDAPGSGLSGDGRNRHLGLLDALIQQYPDRRFVPGIALHEFETWVIAAAVSGQGLLAGTATEDRLQAVADEFGGDVELIDDGPATAPSKRVADAWPGYLKTVDGIEVLESVDQDAVLQKCPSLREWMLQLAPS